jgi:hypothetical protein
MVLVVIVIKEGVKPADMTHLMQNGTVHLTLWMKQGHIQRVLAAWSITKNV